MVEVSDIAIAIACGAFIITQIHLWRVARRLIKKSDASWTKVEGFVTIKYNDLEGKVQTQIKNELSSFAGKIDGIMTEVRALESKLSGEEIDFGPVTGRIDSSISALRVDIEARLAASQNEIKDSVKGTILNLQSLEARRLNKALGPYQDIVDSTGRAIIQEAQAQFDPVTIQLTKLLTTELSDEYRAENPGAAFLIDAGKVAVAQGMKSRGLFSGQPSSSKKDVGSNTPSPFD
jgi:hypothetical protein